MKRILITAVIVFCLMIVGCIKYDQEITLNKDGSGTVALHYAMSQAMVQQMEAMASMASQMGEEAKGGKGETKMSMDNLSFEEEKVKGEFSRLKDHGITLQSSRSYDKEGWRHMEVKFHFKDVSKLKHVSYFKDNDMTIEKNNRGNYEVRTHSKGNGDKQKEEEADIDPETAEQAAEMAKGMEQGMEQMMMPMMQGFRVSFTFHTPTSIVKTNAPEQDKKRARWVFDLEKDQKAMEKMESEDMVIEFSGKGVKLNELK